MGEWLESLLPWGTEVILWVQSFSNPTLDAIFGFFTKLGYEQFYLFVLPLIFWCINRQIGAALGYLTLLSTWGNSVIKYTFKLPRPADPDLRIPLPETSPSFASNHAQGAIVNWGYLAYRFRNRVFWVVAVIAIIGISLSRIVLGVHFPQDVIGGLLIGLIVLLLYARLEPPVSRWIAEQNVVVQLALAVGIPLILIFLHPSDLVGRYPAEPPVTAMSALIGLGVGLVGERAWVRFRVDGEWWRRGLRFLVGIAVVAVFYAGPRLLLPEEMDYGAEMAVRFVRYALTGCSVSLVAPWLFVKLRLAESAER